MRYGALYCMLFLLLFTEPAHAEKQFPKAGIVTMADLRAKSCILCKIMAPILEKLEAECQGKADVVFIDVWQKPEAGKAYSINLIPTQIFLY